jgi:hypothetical protein
MISQGESKKHLHFGPAQTRSSTRLFRVLAPMDLFARPKTSQSWGSIVRGWEARRLYYNLILLIVPAQILIFHWSAFKSLTERWQAFQLYLLLFQLPANLWYTGGWMVDLFLKKALRLSAPGFAPWALAAGIVFSLLFLFFFRISFSPYTGKFSLF